MYTLLLRKRVERVDDGSQYRVYIFSKIETYCSDYAHAPIWCNNSGCATFYCLFCVCRVRSAMQRHVTRTIAENWGTYWLGMGGCVLVDLPSVRR